MKSAGFSTATGPALPPRRAIELLPERLELRLVGLEAPQIGGGIGADGDRFDHLGRVGQSEARVEIGAQALRIDAAAACIAGVVEHGIADLDLGVGEPFGRWDRSR